MTAESVPTTEKPVNDDSEHGERRLGTWLRRLTTRLTQAAESVETPHDSREKIHDMDRDDCRLTPDDSRVPAR